MPTVTRFPPSTLAQAWPGWKCRWPGTRNQSTIWPSHRDTSAAGTRAGIRSALTNRQNGMKRRRKATAMRYSTALVECIVRRS
jgi:hypothetical protein